MSNLGDNFDEDIAIETSYLQKKICNTFISMIISDDSNHPFLSVGNYVGGALGKNKNELINQPFHLKAYNANIEFPVLYNQVIKNIWKII